MTGISTLDPTREREPDVGKYITSHGCVICHIMRKGYIGQKVAMCVPAHGQDRFRVVVLEKIISDIYYDDLDQRMVECDMSVVFDGNERREILHMPGVNIYEIFPWDMTRGFKERKGKNETDLY